MTRIVQATYHTTLKVAEFLTDDGQHILRKGGTLPWRINNCGDLISPVANGKPAPKKTCNYVGFAKVPSKSGEDHHFFIFPDYETGRAELLASLKRKHPEHNLPEVIRTYAPAKENDTASYTRTLLSKTGIPADKLVKNMSEDELNAVMDGIEEIEGYNNEKESRQEIKVPVSRISATDGARPIADEEIVLIIDGKQTTLRSNEVGQFPPIPHSDKPIEVMHITADGDLKKVGEISGDEGKNFSLTTQLKRFFGVTRPEKAPESGSPDRRQPFKYQVQPGDSLDKIAKKFKTTVAAIKQDNNIKRDLIHPGDVLGINGASPQNGAPLPQKPVQRAAPKPTPKAESDTSTPAAKKAPPAATATVPVRADEGSGAPLAILPIDGVRAPWMAYAVSEAKRFKGADEAEIEKTTNYAKEVKTGQTTLVGNSHPWCAAFVNWCLMKAGYPIENPDFYDHVAAKGRAQGFYEVEGKKLDKKDKSAPIVRNPLFVEIEQPIFGAIAMVTSTSGHGHHVGFVYAKEDENHTLLLGGNQSNTIKFSSFSIASELIVRNKMVNGKVVKIKKMSDKLSFFVPAQYFEQSKKDSKATALDISTAKILNKSFGIQSDGDSDIIL
ncbi:MAG: peptidoglycan-binding protein [Rhodocyclales bacterium]|nr:peptidoglycan-binding protein [Rhodocyclales bacterium]